MRKAIVEIPDICGAACIYYMDGEGNMQPVISAEIIDPSPEPVAEVVGGKFSTTYIIATKAANFKAGDKLYAQPPAKEAMGDGLAKAALELVDAMENMNDLPLHKWAVKCAFICNRVRKLAAPNDLCSVVAPEGVR